MSQIGLKVKVGTRVELDIRAKLTQEPNEAQKLKIDTRGKMSMNSILA